MVCERNQEFNLGSSHFGSSKIFQSPQLVVMMHRRSALVVALFGYVAAYVGTGICSTQNSKSFPGPIIPQRVNVSEVLAWHTNDGSWGGLAEEEYDFLAEEEHDFLFENNYDASAFPAGPAMARTKGSYSAPGF